jgi:hypothetical protein
MGEERILRRELELHRRPPAFGSGVQRLASHHMRMQFQLSASDFWLPCLSTHRRATRCARGTKNRRSNRRHTNIPTTEFNTPSTTANPIGAPVSVRNNHKMTPWQIPKKMDVPDKRRRSLLAFCKLLPEASASRSSGCVIRTIYSKRSAPATTESSNTRADGIAGPV